MGNRSDRHHAIADHLDQLLRGMEGTTQDGAPAPQRFQDDAAQSLWIARGHRTEADIHRRLTVGDEVSQFGRRQVVGTEWFDPVARHFGMERVVRGWRHDQRAGPQQRGRAGNSLDVGTQSAVIQPQPSTGPPHGLRQQGVHQSGVQPSGYEVESIVSPWPGRRQQRGSGAGWQPRCEQPRDQGPPVDRRPRRERPHAQQPGHHGVGLIQHRGESIGHDRCE